MLTPLLTLEVRLEPDVVQARQRARQVADLLGFAPLDQTRIATAVSEITRNAFQYAGGGRVEFLVEAGPPPGLAIRIRERGPGIKDLQAILDGQYTSSSGMGLGILGAKRLMDRFEIESTPVGSVVSMAKFIPRRTAPFTAADLARVAASLARHKPQGLLEELQEQNQELLRALQEVRASQAEIAQLHARELDETNRGVVALYAELDDNANALRRISELKSRFLSNMSHEFRSPLNTILSLCGFLLERSDGDLTAEQEKQVHFIRKAAEGLASLVNDLLDLAKVEAGKAVLRLERFEVAELFDVLAGTFGPLVLPSPVRLHFAVADGIPTLRTDAGKVAQVLRNFLSNAVKFTEQGEIRVAAALGPGDTVTFSVADTGIGIAPGDLGRIFEEFGQVESPIQGRVKGTGLGLPLSRKLAELLGGSVTVRSEPGIGSTFVAVIPCTYHTPADEEEEPAPLPRLDPTRSPVLVVEDDPVDILLYEKQLEGSEFQVLPARTLDEARRVLGRVRPTAVLLDVRLAGESGWTLLDEIKAGAATRAIPVLVLTVVDRPERARALGADAFALKPIDGAWLLGTLRTLEKGRPLETVLIVDDEESYRYMLKELLSELGRFAIIEARDGTEGLRRAREDHPDVVFLDLVMPDMTGYEVLERLKADASTQAIPVIINTSKNLEGEDLGRLAAGPAAIVPKTPGTRDEAFARIRDALLMAGIGLGAPESES